MNKEKLSKAEEIDEKIKELEAFLRLWKRDYDIQDVISLIRRPRTLKLGHRFSGTLYNDYSPNERLALGIRNLLYGELERLKQEFDNL